MARNSEKAMTLFSRWTNFKKDFHADISNRKPLLASEAETVQDAEKVRRDLIRDITKKISAVHNATLGEHRIRELNDEINKLMRTKHYWETRIRELGGNVQKGKQFYDVEGKELPGAPGYKYYGAAKELPGVRDLFNAEKEQTEAQRQKRSRADIYRNITPDYYGYRDDDDGVLRAKEAEREEAETEYQSKRKALMGLAGGLTSDEMEMLEDDVDSLSEENSMIQAIQMADNSLLPRTSTAPVDPSKAIEDRKKLLIERLSFL